MDASKTEIYGDTTVVPSGAVTYPDGVTEMLKFHRNLS